MKPSDIDTAVAEAKRFIARADAAKSALRKSEYRNVFYNEDTRATAALKRASMDLTRALVAIRRSS